MSLIYLDIETVPSSESWVREYVSASVTHPGQMKKPETIAKWEAEDKPQAVDDAMDKCAFDGAMNQIVCIGVAIEDEPVHTFVGEEKKLVSEAFSFIGQPGFYAKFVGHNLIGFDLRVLRQRGIVLGLKPPASIPFNAKPWDDARCYDTMVQWDGKNSTKLDKIAKAFGIPGKGSTDGSQVHQMWKDGKINEIAQYCASDVELTRQVYRKMNYVT